MSANVVARLLRVRIGADQQDWSDWVASLSVGDESYGETGLIPARGTLRIQAGVGMPGSIDPDDNPTRWRPGVVVLVDVRDSAGLWTAHPLAGRMVIVAEPDYPEDGVLSLELGCRLAWGSTNAPEGDASGVVYGTTTNTATVARRLLEAVDIPSGAISLGTWPYSVAVPLPNESYNSYPEQAGALARSNDGRYLYQDAGGIIRDRQFSLAATSPLITITLGQNDIQWQRARDPNSPVELVRCAGVGYPVAALANDETETITDSGIPLDDGGTATRETTITNSWTYDPAGTGEVFIFQGNQVRESPALALSNPVGVSGLVIRSNRGEINYYAPAGPPHRLVQGFMTNSQARGVVNPAETTGRANPTTTERSTTDYFYGPDEQLTAIVQTDFAVEVLFDPGSSNPYQERQIRQTVTTWEEISTNRWRRRISTSTARIVANPAVTENKWNMTRSVSSATRSDGSTAPPATEFWDGPFTDIQTQYSGEATWTHPGGATGRERKRLFEIGYGFSDAQMAGLAVQHRDWLVALSRTAVITLPISDTLLAIDEPLWRLDVVDPAGGFRYRYVMDAMQWEHTQTEVAVAGLGLLIGRVAL